MDAENAQLLEEAGMAVFWGKLGSRCFQHTECAESVEGISDSQIHKLQLHKFNHCLHLVR